MFNFSKIFAVVVIMMTLTTGIPTAQAGWLDNIFGGNKNAVTKNGASQIDKVLMSAVRDDDLELAQSAIAKGANVNSYVNGNLPLGIAAQHANYDMANLLLHNGADVEGWYDVSANKHHYYIFMCKLDMIPFFLDWGVSPNIRDDYGLSLIHITLLRNRHSSNRYQLLQYLINKGVDINTKVKTTCLGYEKGQTALMKAASTGDEKAVRILLDAGADYKLKNANGETALDYAIKGRRSNIVKILSNYL